MPEFVIYHDIKEANGKTIRENNLEKQHQIPLGTLVELAAPWYVVGHRRDCDGTPLYSVSMNRTETTSSGMEHGFSEDELLEFITPISVMRASRTLT